MSCDNTQNLRTSEHYQTPSFIVQISSFVCILCAFFFLSYGLFLLCSTSTFLCQSFYHLLIFSSVFSCFFPPSLHFHSFFSPLSVSPCLPNFFSSFHNLSFFSPTRPPLQLSPHPPLYFSSLSYRRTPLPLDVRGVWWTQEGA